MKHIKLFENFKEDSEKIVEMEAILKKLLSDLKGVHNVSPKKRHVGTDSKGKNFLSYDLTGQDSYEWTDEKDEDDAFENKYDGFGFVVGMLPEFSNDPRAKSWLEDQVIFKKFEEEYKGTYIFRFEGVKYELDIMIKEA